MGGARSARESRGYKDLTGEPDVIPSINRRIILNYTLNPPPHSCEWNGPI